MDAAALIASRLADADPIAAATGLDDEGLLELLGEVSDARKALEVIASATSAEVARRSARELGYAGLAQRKGHRNVTSLVQNITGQSKGDVFRSLRTGEELRDAAATPTPDADEPSEPRVPRWSVLLREALTEGRISSTQFQAIRTGLGEPPTERYPDLDPDFLPEAWARAVEILLHEASALSVEDLRNAARIARDRLDPVGVTLRFEERFVARSYRTWVDEHGQHHARISYDDDAAAWVNTILSSALRPRRGPRFVDADATDNERAGAGGEDERTNEQLQYDTLMAILRAGANVDPAQAFGDRQPGVRIIVEESAMDDPTQRGSMGVVGVGHLEDGGQAIPGGLVEKYLCDAGSTTARFDAFGRPLDLGRERRLFTAKQRIVIAARDGGCVWPSCSAPVSWCEFHHIDHWSEDHGRTDVDDGVPLCRNCHMRLHNQGWRITRTRDPETQHDTYWLHPPPDPDTGEIAEPVMLQSKSPRRFEAA
ncbi:hypothetical protein GCM10009775_32020 [Microbacterium aoyamense]|uniref:HNH nuclease domain-containing protein n=1 Tax=Microbacterium aoyamense TaxID=344166 RepID=A0ABP5BB89_9MICO